MTRWRRASRPSPTRCGPEPRYGFLDAIAACGGRGLPWCALRAAAARAAVARPTAVLAAMAEEDVDLERLTAGFVAGRHLAPDRGEGSRQHARRPVPRRVLQRDVGGAVAALRVPGQSPGPARRLDAGDPGYRVRHVPRDEGHVLDAAGVVEAL